VYIRLHVYDPIILFCDSDSGEITGLANEATELQTQLQELYGRVLQLIEEGDEDTARELIEANYEVVSEQLESGYKCMEQIAMLDTLAQLRMSLGEFEEAEYLLDQVLCTLSLICKLLRIQSRALSLLLFRLCMPLFVEFLSLNLLHACRPKI